MCLSQFILISKQQRANLFFQTRECVISYCQIYTFHPSLNLDKIVVFRSFQQKPEEMYDLSHFKKEQEPYFDRANFHQLKDAADNVLARHKSTSLAELFFVELKLTVNTMNARFNSIIKLEILELDTLTKQYYKKDNLID